jgi:hypothetical protein
VADAADQARLHDQLIMQDQIRDMQKRVTWLERQHRMLLVELMRHSPDQTAICADSRCMNGPVPHMAEQPHGCPRLREAADV